jgi:hypothetical protein
MAALAKQIVATALSMIRLTRLLLIASALCVCVGCGCDRRPTDREAKKLIRAIEASDTALADKILAAGVDVNGQDSAGMTPLLQALLSGNEPLFQQLLARGANPNVCTTRGQCVMNQAADRDGPWLELALKYGGDPNALNVGNPYAPNSTPLFYAITPKRVDFEAWQVRNIELLLQANADINHQDAQGSTPLLTAAESGGYEIVVHLLLAGADPTLPNKHGHSTVDWYVERTENMVLRDEQKPWFQKSREMLIERDLLNPYGYKRPRPKQIPPPN